MFSFEFKSSRMERQIEKGFLCRVYVGGVSIEETFQSFTWRVTSKLTRLDHHTDHKEPAWTVMLCKGSHC